MGVDDAVDDAGVVVDAVGGAVVLTVTVLWATMASLLMLTFFWALEVPGRAARDRCAGGPNPALAAGGGVKL